MDKVVFVHNVKAMCAIKGVPPTVACRESGVGASFINNIESRGQTPSVEKVQLLSRYLGCTTSELLGESRTGERDSAAGVQLGHLSPEDLALLRKYHALPSDLVRGKVLGYIDSLLV